MSESIQITATAEGLEGLGGKLEALARLGRSPRPLWSAIANYGENSTRLRFQKQVGPDGQAWKPSRRAIRTGGKTLIKSARLLRSISHTYDGSGAEWGSNVVYARIHQLGGKINRLAHSSWLRLRTDAGGRLLRQKDHANLSVFAKAHHKRAVTKRYTVEAHSIHMPARPYLGVNAADGVEMLHLASDVLDGVQHAG